MTPSAASAAHSFGRMSLVSFSQEGNNTSSASLGAKTHLPQLNVNDDSGSDTNSNSSPKHGHGSSGSTMKFKSGGSSAALSSLAVSSERVPSAGADGKKNRDKGDKGDKGSGRRRSLKAEKSAPSAKK